MTIDGNKAIMSSRPLQGLEVAIIGGSVSGLAAAIFLSDAGADVEVHERTSGSFQRRGSGLFLRPEARGALRGKGISMSPLSAPIDTWRRTVAGVTTDRPWASEATTWDHLQGVLRAEVSDTRYHNGHKLVELDLSGAKPSAQFANGISVTADLIVIADGAGSTGRALLEGQTGPTYAGYTAWRGKVPTSAVDPKIRDQLHGKVTEYVGNENRIVAFEVPSATPGQTGNPAANYIDWNWHINTPEAELPGLLGERFAPSGLLPPGAIDPEVTEWLHSLAHLLPPNLAPIVTTTKIPFARTIVDHPPTRMAWPGIALIGDAAATVRPHTGAASSKAIGDAEALAVCLSQTRQYGVSRQALQYGLEIWEQQRLPVARQFSEVGIRIGGELNLGRTPWGPAHPFPAYRNARMARRGTR